MIALLVALQIVIASGTCPFAYAAADRCCGVATSAPDDCCADNCAGGECEADDCAGNDCEARPDWPSQSCDLPGSALAPDTPPSIDPTGPCTATHEATRHDHDRNDRGLPTRSGCCLDGCGGCSFSMLLPHFVPVRAAAHPAISFVPRPDSRLIATDPTGLDHPPC